MTILIYSDKNPKIQLPKTIPRTSFSIFITLSYCRYLFCLWESYGNMQRISKGELNMINTEKGKAAEKENGKVKENEKGH